MPKSKRRYESPAMVVNQHPVVLLPPSTFDKLSADGMPVSAGVRGAIEREAYWYEEDGHKQAIGLVHVKDGQPLTPIGARLLGVPWKPVNFR